MNCAFSLLRCSIPDFSQCRIFGQDQSCLSCTGYIRRVFWQPVRQSIWLVQLVRLWLFYHDLWRSCRPCFAFAYRAINGLDYNKMDCHRQGNCEGHLSRQGLAQKLFPMKGDENEISFPFCHRSEIHRSHVHHGLRSTTSNHLARHFYRLLPKNAQYLLRYTLRQTWCDLTVSQTRTVASAGTFVASNYAANTIGTQ